ncbi:protein of unknown function DUF214 [Desulfovibrio sp. X2]|uniref:ABC transporter permease n=1 Tax=Desulfovibrio sp. X2 TaxID=941449 RepID=UPI000358F2BE|nr:ABC transporter permease [Desulfovibrio sp. X2]EPR41218.1 protein of unknown function DUF214 [Desulfovibrio sp. X2]
MLLKILFRNAFRHPLRTALTICGMVVAVLAFGSLRTVIDAWYAGVAASSSTRLVTRNAISLIFPLPLSYESRIAGVEGVKTVSYGNWFGAYYVDQKNFFGNFAVQAESYLKLYPEFVVPQAQKRAFLRDRKGALVGKKLADRFGWKVGQTVVLIGTIYPGNWEFTIRGIYHGRDQTADETNFLFHWDYLNETMKRTTPSRADQVGFYMVGVKRPEDAARVAQDIDALFANSSAETLTETEKAFQLGFVSMSEAIITAIRLVSVIIIVIILVVCANTMAMSVRERSAEWAVFKTLGFSGATVALVIVGESLVISCVGGGIGLALTFPLADFFRSALGQYFPIFNVSETTILLDAGLSAAVGFLAGIFPAVSAARIPVAHALRRVG